MSWLRFLLTFSAHATSSPGFASAARLVSPTGAAEDDRSFSHDFWSIWDANPEADDSSFVVSATRLTTAVDDILTDAGNKLTLAGFSDFFKQNGCHVSHRELEGDVAHLTVTRPSASHSCFSADVVGAIVENDNGVLSLSIEIAEYITDRSGAVLDSFLVPAEAALKASLPTNRSVTEEMLRMSDLGWLGAKCDSLGCIGSQLSSDVALALMDVLEGVDPDALMEVLMVSSQAEISVPDNVPKFAEPWGIEADDQQVRRHMIASLAEMSAEVMPRIPNLFAAPANSPDSSSKTPALLPKGEQVYTIQGVAATAGGRVGVASFFHVAERIKVKELQKSAQLEMKQMPWYTRMNARMYMDRLPTFYNRLCFQGASNGIGFQAAFPLAFGAFYPVLRDQFHQKLHPGKEEYTVSSSILASVTASSLIHPFTVMSARRNLGVVNSTQLTRHVHRGMLAAGTSAFLWGAAYGATTGTLNEFLGPARSEKARVGVDALGSLAGIAASSPFTYVAMQQYINPAEKLSARDVFSKLFAQAKASDQPVRQMMKALDMRGRIGWGVPRFALTQMAMRALWDQAQKQIPEK